MRMPRKEAPTFRELRKGVYENRCVPITHQMLPAITVAGRVHDSRDGWIDSRLVGDGERQCRYPGVWAFLQLSERATRVMATDVLGDGMLYMLAREIQVLPHCQPPTGPAKKTAAGGVYYEEGCVIVALLVRQADVTDADNSGRIWANVGEHAANLHVISDELRATRDVRTQQQIDLRAATPPTRPDNKSEW
jgi:hypothetical protein